MFKPDVIEYINEYIVKDLPAEDFFDKKFLYITDSDFRKRIISDYTAARKIYKILEGINDNDDILKFECKIQIILYASIQEAVLSWVLFNLYSESEEVKKIFEYKTFKEYSIPKDKENEILNLLNHDGKDLIPCFIKTGKYAKEKIRFDNKVATAFSLGLISAKMRDDLIKIYEYRNTVHIEAEIKKDIKYDLEMSELAYRKVEGLDIELTKNIFR